ncbi:UDP-arabinose 4-epimerase-like protein [Hapsidospora chrysogenum ATCC 11550]|uniref:UDP-arabinose 4-epimerase-like protein n=1 Tax=Hapsidospora chrysogenum (strain ATCC 11550 / CBS 779.69 / DSM 880 / IAM 14645 / JCM 23072 / IMI 49137) TaxID=857340 RepID=A0A086SYQ6_HAPC1|nr:UDP-arabinose 4-epimerase-like protein [Hapsidospora chrysogenum ATCC 11550]
MPPAVSTSPRPPARTALIIGANGYIGSAVSRAFVRAGWRVFGLVRRPEAATELALSEVIPVIGTLDGGDLHWVDGLLEQAKTLDVIVNCLELFPEYAKIYDKIMGLVLRLANASSRHGVRSLLMWSSGCKDYGLSPLHGDPSLVPQTEDTPLNPVAEPIRQRIQTSLAIFKHKDVLDGVVLRPTSVYGYSSSYYGALMDYAAAEATKGEPALRIPVNPNVPMHATHIDDCAEAYVALAEHEDRAAIAGASFNISAHRYETVREVCDALAAEYCFPAGIEFITEEEAGDWFPKSLHFALNFPQWVGSERIRRLTGWTDKRLLFSENVKAHRIAYEAQDKKGHENIGTVRERMKSFDKMDIRRD